MQTIFVVLRLIFREHSNRHYYSLVLTSALYLGSYRGISAALAPRYDASGALSFSGGDLSDGGVLSYLHDLLYLTLASQTLSTLSDRFWYLLLLVPGYAAYKLFELVLLPRWTAPKVTEEPVSETERDRKRREKKERQAARMQKFARS